MRMVLIASVSLLAGLATSGATAASDDQDRRGHGLSRADAIGIARAHGMVRVAEVEREDGGWEIEGRDRAGREIEIEIDRHGRVTGLERDYDNDRRGYRSISRADALGIARRHGVWRATEVEREDDGGWEIEGRDRAGREIEVEIDGRGRVTEIERD